LLFRDIKNLDRNLAKLVEFTLENKRIQNTMSKQAGRLLQAKQAGNMLAKGDRPLGDLPKATQTTQTRSIWNITIPANKCDVFLFWAKGEGIYQTLF
jgi:hypothetical protein